MQSDEWQGPTWTLLLFLAFSVFAGWISLAAGVKRCHDIGLSGWYLLICYIPIIGLLWYLVLLLKPGDETKNEYGY